MQHPPNPLTSGRVPAVESTELPARSPQPSQTSGPEPVLPTLVPTDLVTVAPGEGQGQSQSQSQRMMATLTPSDLHTLGPVLAELGTMAPNEGVMQTLLPADVHTVGPVLAELGTMARVPIEREPQPAVESRIEPAAETPPVSPPISNPVTPPSAVPQAAASTPASKPAAPAPSSGPPELPHLIGQRIGNYRIERELGRGGMGAVYEAVHESIAQRVAIKVLYPQFARESAYIERFFYEARVVSFIQHPGLVKIFDHGQLDEGSHYILMEFLDGEPLLKRITKLRHTGQRMPLLNALRIARQIASTLSAVHERGIVHRDLKPANVVLNPDPIAPSGERVKILDFGIAKIQSGSDVLSEDAPGPMTRVGTIMGTPTYMSPEQCQGLASVDAKADVYSLGAMIYEMLTGRPPFQTENTAKLLALHILNLPPPLREVAPEVPEAVRELVHEMLAKDPAKRPAMSVVASRVDALEVALLAPAPVAVPPPQPQATSTSQRLPLAIAGVIILALSYLVVTGRSQRAAEPSVPPPSIPSIGPVKPTAPNTLLAPAVEKTVPSAVPGVPAAAVPLATGSPSATAAPVRTNPNPPAAHPTPPVPPRTAPPRRADGSAAAPDPRRKLPPNLRPSGKKPPVPGSRPPAAPPSGSAKPAGGKVEVEIVN